MNVEAFQHLTFVFYSLSEQLLQSQMSKRHNLMEGSHRCTEQHYV